MRPWHEYEHRAARFFRAQGYLASVGESIVGVRAHHAVDVTVRPTQLGMTRLWVVECKAWQRRVPKERVLALRELVADVGADRGFLLSESGFQSGARQAATGTNITLASLAELRELAEQDISRSTALSDFEASYHAHEDHGMGADTDFYLRRRDGGVLELPISCVLIDGSRSWTYSLHSRDLQNEGSSVRICLYHFFSSNPDGPPAGHTYRVIWRTPDGPIHSWASVDIEK